MADFRVQIWISRHGGIAALILLLVIIVISSFWIPVLQDLLDSTLATEDRLQGLRSLFQTLGGALLGATAIVSSLVLFSMQVNVERMPHGLFRRLSNDLWLLSAFLAAFLLAILVVVLSLVPERDLIGFATFVAFWATIMILILFLYAYRRALVLINPLSQLKIVVERTNQELGEWERRAQRAAPLIKKPNLKDDKSNDPSIPKHDLARLVYFGANAAWTEGAKQGVRHAVSFARRYAEQGDHEVSFAAMNAIVKINAAYIDAKGRTFFSYQLMFDNPLTSDSFINDTLEHLRQLARMGVSRGDEQQIEQTLQTLAALVRVYAVIDYGTPIASKTHAHLAAAYLTSEIERIIPQNMPDVLIEGTRLIGQCANLLLKVEGPNGITTLVQKLGVFGCCGVMKEDYRPVTSTCVEQLARLSFDLLRAHSREVRTVAQEIRCSLAFLARSILALPETPLSNTHSIFLGAYYSSTSTQALPMRLVELVNTLVDSKADDKNAQQILENIESWAEGLYSNEKDLLLEAVKRRSHFTFDMVHWISQVTSILLVVSNAPACNDRTRMQLREHALWLISVFSFVPEDVETINFIENFGMTETLFNAALDANNRGCPDIAADITHLLVSWMFKGGQYRSGRAILECSIYALAVMALIIEPTLSGAALKAELAKKLAAGGLPDQDVRDHAAIEIRGRAAALHRDHYGISFIESCMAQADHAKLKPLLEELADLISPRTVGKAACHSHF